MMNDESAGGDEDNAFESKSLELDFADNQCNQNYLGKYERQAEPLRRAERSCFDFLLLSHERDLSE